MIRLPFKSPARAIAGTGICRRAYRRLAGYDFSLEARDDSITGSMGTTESTISRRRSASSSADCHQRECTTAGLQTPVSTGDTGPIAERTYRTFERHTG